MLKKKGTLLVLSGFSGSGKGTVVSEMMRRHPELVLSISATTREMREGEIDGEHYFFIERTEFERRIRDGELIEYTEYQGNYYGTPRTYVEEQLSAGKDVLLEIDVVGGAQIRDLFPDALLFFLITPTADELMRRLVDRGTNTKEQIIGRMTRARDEMDYIPRYDYLLINDDLQQCVDSFSDILKISRLRTCFFDPEAAETYKDALSRGLETL